MALTGKYTTDREKAAIYYHIFAGVDDWETLYLLASDSSINEARMSKHLDTYVSRWKRSFKIQELIKEIRDQRVNIEAAAMAKGIQEAEIKAETENRNQDNDNGDGIGDTQSTQNGRKRAFVDYTQPENQRRKLNELVNRATDAGEALDALKVIISGQKDDRQAAKDQKQVRVYLPLVCSDCPLYEKAAKSVTI